MILAELISVPYAINKKLWQILQKQQLKLKLELREN